MRSRRPRASDRKIGVRGKAESAESRNLPAAPEREFLDQLNKKILPPKLADWIRGAGKKPRMVARLTKETA